MTGQVSFARDFGGLVAASRIFAIQNFMVRCGKDVAKAWLEVRPFGWPLHIIFPFPGYHGKLDGQFVWQLLSSTEPTSAPRRLDLDEGHTHM